MCKSLVVALGLMLASAVTMLAAPKTHVVVLGKSTVVTLFLSNEGRNSRTVPIRPLYVDGRLREFTIGGSHYITEHQFVIQRAFRVNDALPQDGNGLPRWRWQRGNWLLVDRASGKVSTLHLPSFDPFYSQAVWYRDYVAYCGVSEEGDQLFAMVSQVGIRKPLVTRKLGEVTGTEPEPVCQPPGWQREPARAIFTLKDGKAVTLLPHGRAVEYRQSPDSSADGEE